MKNKETRFLVLFAAIAVLVFAASVFLRGRSAMAPSGADSIAVSTDANSDGDETVADATADYYFSMPANWYAEKNAGAGMTVYPDYDPNSGTPPECKIELSTFADANDASLDTAGLNAWITSELHADPTADVAEISRTPVTVGEAGDSAVGEASATSSAIEWLGALNGVTTTLVYAIEPSSNGSESGNILEIAPSTLSEASNPADNDDCDLDLRAFLANLQFGAYEP